MKGWVTGFLIIALAVVGYLWYSSTTNRDEVARDIGNTGNQVADQVNDGTRNNNNVGQLAEPTVDRTGKNAKPCTECHKPGTQYSLSNEAKGIEGHPPVNSDEVSTCMRCHANESKDYAFMYVLHTGHLGSEDSHFVTNYNGQCTTCHQMTQNGKVVVVGVNDQG